MCLTREIIPPISPFLNTFNLMDDTLRIDKSFPRLLMTRRRVDYPNRCAEIIDVPSSYCIQTTPAFRASPTELSRATVVN